MAKTFSRVKASRTSQQQGAHFLEVLRGARPAVEKGLQGGFLFRDCAVVEEAQNGIRQLSLDQVVGNALLLGEPGVVQAIQVVQNLEGRTEGVDAGRQTLLVGEEL